MWESNNLSFKAKWESIKSIKAVLWKISALLKTEEKVWNVFGSVFTEKGSQDNDIILKENKCTISEKRKLQMW